MKTIQFQVTDSEFEQARLIVRELYACLPGFDVSGLARLGHDLWCQDMMKKIDARNALKNTRPGHGGDAPEENTLTFHKCRHCPHRWKPWDSPQSAS